MPKGGIPVIPLRARKAACRWSARTLLVTNLTEIFRLNNFITIMDFK